MVVVLERASWRGSARGRGIAVGIAVLASVAAGCGVAPATGTDAMVRDSAGVIIVESPAAAVRPAGWRVSEAPDLEIGAVEGDAAYQLFRVSGAAQLSDGRVVVVNGGTQELRFFDAGGRFQGSAGRAGAGPGEYSIPQLFALLPGDSILIFDLAARRFTLLDGSGRLIRTLPAPAAVPGMPEGRFASGRLVFTSGGAMARADTPESLMENRVTYALVDVESERADTLFELGGHRLFLWNVGGRIGFTTVPFTQRPAHVVDGAGFYIHPVPSAEIRRYDDAGRLTHVLRVDRPAVPVTRADFERFVEAQVARGADDDARAELRRRYARMTRPDFATAYRRLMTDARGRLWAEAFRASTDEPPVWHVFGEDGALLGTVELPAGLYVHQLGEGFVLGVWRDELGIEHVRRHRLAR